VATLLVIPCDASSLEINQAHVRQRTDISGAVTPGSPATELCRWGGTTSRSRTSNRASRAERGSLVSARLVCSAFPWNRSSARLLVARLVRCARLCVLIEPNPAGCVGPPGPCRRMHLQFCLVWSLSGRNHPIVFDELNSPGGNPDEASRSMPYVPSNLCSCGPGIPAIPKRVKHFNLAPRIFTPATNQAPEGEHPISSLRTGAF
jgi:hypothetical protein